MQRTYSNRRRVELRSRRIHCFRRVHLLVQRLRHISQDPKWAHSAHCAHFRNLEVWCWSCEDAFAKFTGLQN